MELSLRKKEDCVIDCHLKLLEGQLYVTEGLEIECQY